MKYHLRVSFYANIVQRTGKLWSLNYTSSLSKSSAFALAFTRLLRVFYLSRMAMASEIAFQKVLEVSLSWSAPFQDQRTGVIQAHSRNQMRFPSIAIASLQRARRSGAAGLLLMGSVAFAGVDPQILGHSLNIDGIKTSFALPRGNTSFVIRLAGFAQDRSFTFVNENAAAEGHLLIAVSDQPLIAGSPLWRAVEGKIRFRHKRLFTLSLVGVEAKYLRLTFEVKVSDENRRNDFSTDQRPRENTETHSASAFPRKIVTAAQPSTTATLRR